MHLNHLPEEIVRLIYEYDDTYKTFFTNCVEELKMLYNGFDEKHNYTFIHTDENGVINIEVLQHIPIRRLVKYYKYIFEYCKRKRTLRSYKKKYKA